MALTIGTRLGSYEIQSALGAGGMGEVYKARDTRLDRIVAIKVLLQEVAAEPDFRQRFEREARAVAALNHPHVCTLYDIGHQDGIDFLVMEFLEGQTLANAIQGGLPWQVAIHYAIQIADGIAEAHRCGVIHRDLKPSNVMLTRSGLKIVDFGVAKQIASVTASESLLTTGNLEAGHGSIVGTILYMAPEQLEGRPVDPSADVFSLGAVLYEMLTGIAAFQGASLPEVIAAVFGRQPEPPFRVVSDIPTELSALVLRCLDKNPGARPSGETVAQQLRAVASSPRPLRVLAPTSRRGRQPMKAVAVLPLTTTAQSEATDAFLEGITEGLITALSAFRSLRVISRVSAMQYRNTVKPIATIARELNVDVILAGSVGEHETGGLSVSLELVEAANATRLWSETYRFDRRDILDAQEQIAHAVAQHIRPGSTPKHKARQGQSISREGHDAYLKGRFHFDNRIGNWLAVSFDAFQKAIKCDRHFAPAHAALSRWFVADSLRAKGGYESHRLANGLRKGEEEARAALRLDSTLAEAHTALGQIMWLQWRFAEAESAYVRSLELNPSSTFTHTSYSECLTILNRPIEALEHADLAKRLDPLATYVYEASAQAFYGARHYRECVSACLAGLELTPRAGVLWYFKALAELFGGDIESALASARYAGEALPNHPSGRAALALVLAGRGDLPEATEILQSLIRDDEAVSVAEVQTALGRVSDALDWLEVAFERHSPNLLSVGADPTFDALRDRPRFERLLRGIGLQALGDDGSPSGAIQ